MSSRTLVFAFLGLGLAAGGVLALRKSRPPAIRLVNQFDQVEALLAGRSSEIALEAPAAARLPPIETMPEDVARKLFSMPEHSYDYDPHTYFRFKAGLNRKEIFADYPGGSFLRRTNSLGLREDKELPEPCDLRVLVAGDSHTDGALENPENFTRLLELGLAEQRPGQCIEALNTGVPGYGFWHYMGVLEKFRDWQPQAFVVLAYGGNDFLDVLNPWHYYHRTSTPPRSQAYWSKIAAAQAVSSAGVANAFNELIFFQFYPEEMELAVRGAIELTLEMQRRCQKRRIPMLVVYLPLAFQAGKVNSEMIARTKEALALSDFDLELYDRLADRWLGEIRAQGVDVIDLRTVFPANREHLYWEDLHINIEGHKAVAQAILPRLQALLGN